jgi:hypothetical protein
VQGPATGLAGLAAEPALRRNASLLRLLELQRLPLLELRHLLHHALLQDPVQQGVLLHDLARQQRMQLQELLLSLPLLFIPNHVCLFVVEYAVGRGPPRPAEELRSSVQQGQARVVPGLGQAGLKKVCRPVAVLGVLCGGAWKPALALAPWRQDR